MITLCVRGEAEELEQQGRIQVNGEQNKVFQDYMSEYLREGTGLREADNPVGPDCLSEEG